jgi:hypothetical protein
MTADMDRAWRAYATVQAADYEQQAARAMSLARRTRGHARRQWVEEARRLNRAARARWNWAQREVTP